MQVLKMLIHFIVQLEKKHSYNINVITNLITKKKNIRYREAVKFKGIFTKFYILLESSNCITGHKYYQMVSLKWQVSFFF